MSEFVEFPKMGRLTRDCVVTEKIDGTNAQINIVAFTDELPTIPPLIAMRNGVGLYAGSRTRYIYQGADIFGFAAWVAAHAEELFALGEGRHYGEWWGSGIQRGYGLTEKRFSLFNVARWHAAGAEPYVMQGADPRQPPKVSTEAPACCGVVPILYRGLFSPNVADNMILKLTHEGSAAAPGFMDAEGIVIYHTAIGTMFKKTIKGDDAPKSKHVPRVPVASPVSVPAVESVDGVTAG